MDPYAAQWAQYGYAIGADPHAQAAYSAYNYYPGVHAPAPPVQPQPPPPPHGYKAPRPSRPHVVAQIPTNSHPQTSGATATAAPSWNNPNILPATTYVPTKTFVKASGSVSDPNAIYDPANSTMKLHQLAMHNHIIEVFEKVDGVSQGMQAVRLKLGSEVYTGVGPSFKLAKQDAANKALTETKLNKPVERKTLKPRPLGVTATQELHELATKKGLTVKFKFLEPFNFEFKATMRLWSKEEMRGNYRVQLMVGTMEFLGHADLPQQAKHNAAVQALPYLHQMPDIKPVSKAVTVPTSAIKRESAESAFAGPQGKNVIMVLNEIAMTQQVCMDWSMVDEDGPPHMRAFTWILKMGSYEAVGSGNSKKLAKAIAAQNMFQTIPDEWKDVIANKIPKKSKPGKRKKPMPGVGESSSDVVTSTNTTLDKIEIPGEKRLKAGGEGDNTPKAAKPVVPIYTVITTGNPISALFEYCKKVKYPDPAFECVSEDVLETWQKNNHTFKKTEYTMKLEVAGKTFYGSANTKKAAKTAVATEAWNIIRAGTM